MILFFGREDDSSLARAREEAADLGVAHVLVDQRRLDACEVWVEVGDGGVAGAVTVAGQMVPLIEISAVYARPLALPIGRHDAVAASRALAGNELLVEWLELTDALVVNRPSTMASNSSKPFQAQIIASCGLTVPDTLVTNNPDDVLAFRERHGRVIFKSVSGIRSIVRELDDAHESRLPLVRSLPTQFQAYVPGVDVRVHVVGAEVFATEIRSAAMDYRYASREGPDAELVVCGLDEVTADRCRHLAQVLGLPLCGIDLRRRSDGQYVCFEANPMPAFSYYESHTGQPIARALTKMLAGEDGERISAATL